MPAATATRSQQLQQLPHSEQQLPRRASPRRVVPSACCVPEGRSISATKPARGCMMWVHDDRGWLWLGRQRRQYRYREGSTGLGDGVRLVGTAYVWSHSPVPSKRRKADGHGEERGRVLCSQRVIFGFQRRMGLSRPLHTIRPRSLGYPLEPGLPVSDTRRPRAAALVDTG